MDIPKAVKEQEEKAKLAFKSENEKTKEIQYRASTAADTRFDKTNLKTQKNQPEGLDPPKSSRNTNPNDLIIEFKERLTLNVAVPSHRKHSEEPRMTFSGFTQGDGATELSKKKSSMLVKEDFTGLNSINKSFVPGNHKASHSEGKPINPTSKVGVALYALVILEKETI